MSDAPPPPAGPSPPPWNPVPPPSGGTGAAVLAGFGGVLVSVALSAVLLLGDLPTGVFAGVMAGVVFLGGGGLCFVKSSASRGFGVGLMVGWALLSVTTAGVCTGLADLHS